MSNTFVRLTGSTHPPDPGSCNAKVLGLDSHISRTGWKFLARNMAGGAQFLSNLITLLYDRMQVDERLSNQRTDKEALRYLRFGSSVTRHSNLYFLNNLGNIDGAPPSANGEGKMVVKVKDDVAGVSVDSSGHEMVETVTLL
nr:hypothetical protein CFP56_21050 [Quercus suber]